METTNNIHDIFAEGGTVTMPAENYLFLYERIKKLERELAIYKREYKNLWNKFKQLKEETEQL